MRLETLSLVVAVLATASGQQYSFGGGAELGQVRARQVNNHYNNAGHDRSGQRRDSNRFNGGVQQNARWAGQGAVKDNQLSNNAQALQHRAQLANQNFGRFSNNFGNVAQQIRDEALRNQYKITDNAQYRRNNINSAEGANQANARKTAYDKGEVLDDNINYNFAKRFDKSSSENGGYEEENGRNLHKLDLIDEREKDRKLLRGDSAVSRSQQDNKATAKDLVWRAKAQQAQNQNGKYGFADKRVDQAGERSDDRSVDYDSKQSRYLEQERGRDEAKRIAKDLAEQGAAYDNLAAAKADANRNVADKKYYQGNQKGANPIAAGHYGPENAYEAKAVIGGNKAKNEGQGGLIKSGFDENAAQQERGNELAAAKALSSAEAVNDYQRNKDKLAYDSVKGLQDRTQGQFKQGLQNAQSQGFSGNKAEASKSHAEFDNSKASSRANSDLAARERNENEALRDRNYVRKIQNDDNETFTRRKQFYHNKREGGNNDENLRYNRKKNARNFGAADEADLYKRNNFRNLHQNGKVATNQRNFEDLIDRRGSLQNAQQQASAAKRGFQHADQAQKAQGQTASTGNSRTVAKAIRDDSQSNLLNQRESVQDQNTGERSQARDVQATSRNVQADIQYRKPSNGSPLGDVSAQDLIGQGLLRGTVQQKGLRDYSIPDVVVNIQPIASPVKVTPPQRTRPLPPLPDVQQVKTYSPPKYNKAEANYDTGTVRRYSNFNRPSFSRIGRVSLFQGPRTSTFNTKQVQTPKSRFTLQQIGQKPATSAFGRTQGLFAGRLSGYARGTYAG